MFSTYKKGVGGGSEANGGFVILKVDELTPPQKERGIGIGEQYYVYLL